MFNPRVGTKFMKINILKIPHFPYKLYVYNFIYAFVLSIIKKTCFAKNFINKVFQSIPNYDRYSRNWLYVRSLLMQISVHSFGKIL